MKIRIKRFSFTFAEQIFISIWTFYSVFYFLCSASELAYTYSLGTLVSIVSYITIALQLLAVIFVGKYSWRRTLIYIAVLVIVFLIELQNTDRSLLIYILFIIMAQEIDFQKLLRFDIILKILLFIGIVGLCLAGVINNYTDTINGIYKQSFGFNHPNVFTCFALTILIEYLCVRFRKMKWFEWVLVLVAWGLVAWLGGGRASSYTFIVLFILFIIATCAPKFFYRKPLKVIFVVITPFMAVFSFVSVWLYQRGSGFFIALNSIFTGRLSNAAGFLNNYSIKLFGQEVEYVGTRTSLVTGEARQILDNAYIRCAINWGAILFIVIIVLYSYLFWKLLQNKRVDLALMGLFFVVLGFGENYMLNALYNLSFLCLLGAVGMEKERPPIKLDG